MKVLWSLDKTRAVPMHHIRVFEIEDNTKMTDHNKERLGIKDYSVIVRYQICTGDWFRVFTADTKAECVHFIDEMEEYL